MAGDAARFWLRGYLFRGDRLLSDLLLFWCLSVQPELRHININDWLEIAPHQMGKDSDKREKTESARRRWNERRTKYTCVDKVGVEVASRAQRLNL